MKDKYKLLNSEKWFDVLTSHLPMVFYILDQHGVFMMSEGLGLKKLGLEPGQVLGTSAFEAYKDYPEIVDAINRALNGEDVVFEHNVGDFYIENRMVPQYDENGQVIALVCAAIDISERVKVEHSLENEKTFSKAMLESIPGIFYLYNDEYKLVHWNKNHEVMTGFSKEELAGMKLHDWFRGDEDALLALKNINKRLLKGETSNSEMPLLTKSGKRIPMQFSSVMIMLEGKSYISGIGLDISELKHAQKELEDTNKSLEEKVLERTRELLDANRELLESYEKVRTMQSHLIQSEKMAALGSLVAGVTHEINTPIGVGVTAASHLMEITQEFMNIIQAGSAGNDDIAAYIEDIEQAASIIFKNLNRAGKLVKSFKQVSADQSSEPRRQFLVREYLEEILTSLSPKLKKTRIKVTVDCDSALSIDGYPGAFAQIISNLVINSLVHAFGPDDAGNINIRASERKDMIELVYSDDGKGISSVNISKVFDPFYTTNRSGGGTGLGLSVVYNMVTQQYGGTIQCDSWPGMGTTFVMLLKQGGI